MKALELSQATGPLSDYARKARRETLVLTKRGKAVAAVISLDDDDYFSMRLAKDPQFIAIIEHGRAQHKAHGGISLVEMLRKHGLGPKAKRKTSRKPA